MLSRSLFISTKSTPNPDSIMFHMGEPVLEAVDKTTPREFSVDNPKQLIISPLARNLFGIEGITRVMYGTDFITLTKTSSSDWLLLKPEIFSVLTQHFSSGAPLYIGGNLKKDINVDKEIGLTDDENNELVTMIEELIESRIKPFIQSDGGDVEFIDYIDGVVRVRLMGACVGCPSSVDTLKGGIERMLHYYVPQVTSVQDIDEEVIQKAFDSLETRLDGINPTSND